MERSDQFNQANPPQAFHRYLDQYHSQGYRSKEINALVQAICARENRLVVGLPGFGVSNLLRFLVARRDLFKRRVTFAYVNGDSLQGDRGLDAICEDVVWQFCEQGLCGPLDERVRGYERLKRALQQATGSRMDRAVIVVDQADSVLATADEAFYGQLKALADMNKRICYIFAVKPSLMGEIDPAGLLFAGRRLVVGRFSEGDCVSAVREEGQRLEAGFGAAFQEKLIYLTGGHPGLLRALSSATVNEGLDLTLSEDVLMEQFLSREDVQYRCNKMWKELDLMQKSVIWSLASEQPAEPMPETLARLNELGLVDHRKGEYRLFSPIFHRFVVAQQVPLLPIRIDKPTFVRQNGQEIIQTGRVFKGNQPIDVAPLELRLIACLKREQKVYSKDAVAAYVYYEDWQDPDEGVSDSRISNLVRQVRRRLGSERYIKTHWGQGYEFCG